MMRRLSSLLSVVFLFPMLGDARSEAEATILVDPLKVEGKVNRMVLGQNIEAAESFGIMEGHSRNDPRLLSMGRGFWDPSKKAPFPFVVEESRKVGMELLRYPGGCLAHNYDWRKSVGPLESRPDWQFGLDEFLALCASIGAQPVITVSDYVLPANELPSHLADLVEYLNAPAIPAHPWAMKRKEWGHPEPYGVKYFELGNESDHGNHDVVPFRRYAPEEYAAYAVASASAMRKIDPTIRLGIVTVPSHDHVSGDWNRKVLKLAGGIADYVVVHFYIPAQNFHRTKVPEDLLINACMAAGEQVEFYLQDYHRVIREECGRDLPIAVTEFNAFFLGDGPKPYRLSYASAFAAADMIRIFLLPKMNIELANYWQFLNGYWGMLTSEMDKPDGGSIKERPAYPLFKLWADHLKDVLVESRVNSPTASFPGGLKVSRAQGSALEVPSSLGEIPVGKLIDFAPLSKVGGVGETDGQGQLSVTLKGYVGDTYLRLAKIPWPGAKESGIWKLSYDARFIPDAGAEQVPLALGFSDERGWKATFSSGLIGEIGSSEWTSTQGTFNSLPESPGVEFWLRLETKKYSAISGRLEIRNLKIEALTPLAFPEYPLLTALASVSDDRKSLSVIVFNKSNTTAIPATIRIAENTFASAKYSEVNGADLGTLDQVREVIKDAEVRRVGDGFPHTFPPHSMTALEFSLKP